MESTSKLTWLYEFLLEFEKKYVQEQEQRPQGGAPLTYSHSSFLLFFISMFVQRIFAFKAMSRYARRHYARYHFAKAPSRKTIRTRFKKMPKFIGFLMPCIAKHCVQYLCRNVFGLKCLFSDKSIFRAKGGVWHKKHKAQGIVPHSSIDTEASWAKSPYHNWRFGYGLLLFVNEYRFPVACFADTASFNEPTQALALAKHFQEYLAILVGDAAYAVWKLVKQLEQDFHILLLTKWKKLVAKTAVEQHYKALVDTVQAHWLYAQRKPSVEPCFSLIKELFNLKGESQLPYKGKEYVTAFLMTTAICVQLLIIFNFCHQHKLRSFEAFLCLFR